MKKISLENIWILLVVPLIVFGTLNTILLSHYKKVELQASIDELSSTIECDRILLKKLINLIEATK